MALSLLYAGCTGLGTQSSIPVSTRHAIAAAAAGRQNNWDAARIHWATAVSCAEQEDRAQTTLADMYFEYGRSLAVLGEFKEAETYLSKALEIDKKTHGNQEVVLRELARLNLDQRNFKEASIHYEALLLLLTKINLDSARPEDFTTILSEYSECLAQTGRDQDAQTINALINKLETDGLYKRTALARIPYGNRTVNHPIPSHKFETVDAEPEKPVDLSLYITPKPAKPDHRFYDHLITQIMIQVILHQ